tara:strand:+ start:119 stop:664 length:546 start_codon:yes stop_codon:yes gene_type:complete
MVDAKSLLMGFSAVVATAAAGAVGGPVAAAEVAAFLASPPGRKLNSALIEQTAAKRGVRIEDLAMGGLVTEPTFGLTGEAGPEMVIPFNRNRSEAEYMNLRDFAQSTKNQALENQLAKESGTRPMKFTKAKRSKSARASDKKLSRAFKMANSKLRLKNGQLRKGRTQADVARMAQRLRKKM